MTNESTKADASATPPFSAQDAMAFMQRIWNPFAMPMPGSAGGAVAPTDSPAAGTDAPAPQTTHSAQPSAVHAMIGSMMPGMLPFPNPAAMFAALDPVEVERKIGELRIIEGWLAMSLNLMQMSINTLELQHASLEALHAAHAPTNPKGESKPKKR
jgi:hypothetical protein